MGSKLLRILRRTLTGIVALAAVAGMATASTGSGDGFEPGNGQARIPAVQGTALSGEPVSLPDALKGKLGVLVLGFSQGSRDAVTVWGKRLSADYRDSPTVAYYEMPVLAGAPKLLRGMIARSMKGSVPEREQPRFVPIVDSEPAWRAVAHYSKADDPYVILVDSQGAVLWQTEGAASDAVYAELQRKLESVRDSAHPAGGPDAR